MEKCDLIQTGGSEVGTLLKRDTGGRVRYSEKFRAEVVSAYRASSMSAAAFARHCGVKYPTFASWVRKDDKEKGARGDTSGEDYTNKRFVVATMGGCGATPPSAGSGARLELELAPGMVARITDRQSVALLADLARELSGSARGRAAC